MNELTLRLQSALNSRLHEGEHVMWVGRPDPSRMSRLWVPYAIVALVVWVGVAYAFDMATPTARIHDILFYIIVFLIGLTWVTAPLSQRRMAQITIYAITEKRAIIVTCPNPKRTGDSSYGPEYMKTIRIRRVGNEISDVAFDGGRFRGHSGLIQGVFYGVTNATEAEEILRKIANAAS